MLLDSVQDTGAVTLNVFIFKPIDNIADGKKDIFDISWVAARPVEEIEYGFPVGKFVTVVGRPF